MVFLPATVRGVSKSNIMEIRIKLKSLLTGNSGSG